MRGVQEVREIFDGHLVELRCTGVAALPLHLLIYIHGVLGTVAITPQQIPPQFTHTTLYTHSPHAHALTRTRTRTLTRTHKMSTRTPRTHCRSAVGTVAITPRFTCTHTVTAHAHTHTAFKDGSVFPHPGLAEVPHVQHMGTMNVSWACASPPSSMAMVGQPGGGPINPLPDPGISSRAQSTPCTLRPATAPRPLGLGGRPRAHPDRTRARYNRTRVGEV